jgi:tetratricopeptide (TPR) repeat protein
MFQAESSLNRSVLPIVSAIALLVRAAPAQQGQLDSSPILFTVMAALNAAGYDADLESPNNSPLRQEVRAELARRDIPSLAAIKEFVAKHHQPRDTDELGQYISFALSAGLPPDFRVRAGDAPPEVVPMRELSGLLAAFYKEANIEDLYRRAQPSIDKLIEPYHEGVLDALLQVNAYLRQDVSGFQGRRFQVFFEPLAPPGQMQTRSYGNYYTVVITPSPRARITEVRHAYLYYLLDPLATRNQEILLRKKALADHALRAQMLGDAYKQDFLLLTTGSLVRAVEARMDHTPDTVPQSLREGYILTPYFYEALAGFEKQEESMALYYRSMVQAIDLYREDQRLVPVDFASAAPAPPAAVAAPDPKTVVPPIYETLNQADDLLKKADYDNAEKLFQEAANQTGNKRVRAAGYFGLARIALALGEADDAEPLLETVLTLEPEAPIRAWALVYLGKLRLEVNDREHATEYFQNALQVDGAPESARKEAREGLQKSLKQ